KTNILEALYFFKFGRSFRTKRDNDLIRFDEAFCRAEVEAEYKDGTIDRLTVAIERGGHKHLKINGEGLPKLAELVGRYPIVLFGPQDLILVAGFAVERRRFLDMTGSMTDPRYLDAVRQYRRVLNQRNASLKLGGSTRERHTWNEELIKRGCALLEKRMQLVESLKDHLTPHLSRMSVSYPLYIEYESELIADLPEGVSREENFAARLAAVEGDESRRKTTLVGPHRDDLRIVADGKDLRRFGSQGQRRLFVVLARLAELAYLENELGEPCVLLLDDLFSELDSEISGKLKHLLQDGRQIFVTSPVPIEWDGTENVKSFQVSDGRVTATAP
ncbi:MAG: DNA replication and repair protein RecF, partial [bacterium]|nr:DNA replication and repair protein RecF [bacterium]